ncbi:hypothetical protein DIPPA_19954 [Diplonema papillatum]|nr:hypothetical protein DIPPA_19954 [Diplonema papillatum]
MVHVCRALAVSADADRLKLTGLRRRCTVCWQAAAAKAASATPGHGPGDQPPRARLHQKQVRRPKAKAQTQ